MLVKKNVDKCEYLQFHFVLSLVYKLLIDIGVMDRNLNWRISDTWVHYIWSVKLVGYTSVSVWFLLTVHWGLADWNWVTYFFDRDLFFFRLLALLNKVCERFSFMLNFVLCLLLIWHFSDVLIILIVVKRCLYSRLLRILGLGLLRILNLRRWLNLSKFFDLRSWLFLMLSLPQNLLLQFIKSMSQVFLVFAFAYHNESLTD